MNIRKIFYYYWQSTKKYKFLFLGVFVFYGIAVTFANAINPLLFKNIIDSISNTDPSLKSSSEVLRYVYLLALNILFYNIFYRAGDIAISYSEARSMRDISKDTFVRLARHSYNFYANSFAGALVAKAKRFTHSFEGIFDRISFDLYFIFLRITGVLVVLFLEVKIVAFIFLGWLAIYVFIMYLFLKQKRKYDLLTAEADSAVTASIADIITNILNLKIFASQDIERKRHNRIIDKEYKALITGWNVSNFQLMVQGIMIGLLQAGSVFVMVNLWLRGEVSTGTVVLVQTYIMILFDSLWNMGRAMMRLIKDLSNAKEMVDIFEKPIDILDPENPEKVNITKGKIEFKNVNFEYVKDNEVFKDFSLTINAGEKVGLVGHSGSGKTTITKMLLRFVDVKSGEILIDGQNIKNITQDDLRSKISYVPQEPILFHRSLEENIGYSKSDATIEEIIDSAKKAHADEFIKKLPDGYNTLVGERGIKLSGGERQRVAIARSMLKDAPLLILDEATSSLDSISESYIQDAFSKLMEGKTTIAIAHRLSTIQKMDRILVLDGGRVVEEGTHNDLLNKHGLYAKLWEHQTSAIIA